MATSSLIPGMNRFADLPNEVMSKTSFFSSVKNDFAIRPSYSKSPMFDSIFGRFVDVVGEQNGYEVVYPNGKVCSHIFDSEQSASEFIKEVKGRL